MNEVCTSLLILSAASLLILSAASLLILSAAKDLPSARSKLVASSGGFLSRSFAALRMRYVLLRVR
jgi:hypothetical protein